MAQAKRRVDKNVSSNRNPSNQTFRAIGYQLSQLFSEVIFIISLVVGIGILVALLTYNTHDSVWTHVTSNEDYQNWLGKPGAYVADILFFMVGWVAYLIPVILGVWGWVSAHSHKGGLFDLEAFLFRTLGGIVAIAGFVGLAHLFLPAVSDFAPGGGAVGDLIARMLSGSFGQYIAALLLLAFVVAGITLVTAMGWGQIIKMIAGSCMAMLGIGQHYLSKNKTAGEPISDGEIPARQDIGYDEDFDLPVGESTETKQSSSPEIITSTVGASAVSEPVTEVSAEDDSWEPAHDPEPELYSDEVIEDTVTISPNHEQLVEREPIVDDEPLSAPKPETKKPLSPFAFAARFKGAGRREKNIAPVIPPVAASSAPEAAQTHHEISPASTSPPIDHQKESVAQPVQMPELDKRETPLGEPSGQEGIIASIDDVSVEKSEVETPHEEPTPAPMAVPTGKPPIVNEQKLEPVMPREATVVQPPQPPVKKLPEAAEGEAIAVIPASQDLLAIMATKKAKLSNGLLPSIDLLDAPVISLQNEELSEAKLREKSEQLETHLKSYGIEAIVKRVSAGPVITLYEIDPAPGVKVSQINNLSKDIARGLAVSGVRVLETIPGSTHIGIEVPNQKRETVYLREVFESQTFRKSTAPLTLVLGKNISGQSVVANLAKMPHLLVAGTTGSGKSVAVNAMLLSMLYKTTPHELRLIMIDPKMLELSIYNDIPHLLTPVVTDMKEAENSLRWCVTEMERRYQLLAKLKVRTIASYNEMVSDALARGEPIPNPLYKVDPTSQLNPEPPPLEPLPFIVVVIDELADMMMVVGKKVEELIARLAQKARAAGIHLILATQRPSVDVITGLIKANVPTRIAFQVSSRVDSRTILDTQGAENLLGNGDMLYMPPGSGQPMRAHGAFVDDDEVIRVVEFLKTTGEPDYIPDVTVSAEEKAAEEGAADAGNEQDALYDEAVAIVTTSRKASISYLQRQLRIGFNRAARLVEDMELAGILSTPDSSGQREVIAPPPPEL